MKNAHEPADVSSFYHLNGVDLSRACCQGTACFVARHLNPDRWREAAVQSPRVYCLGKCYAAPSAAADECRPRIEVRSRIRRRAGTDCRGRSPDTGGLPAGMADWKPLNGPSVSARSKSLPKSKHPN